MGWIRSMSVARASDTFVELVAAAYLRALVAAARRCWRGAVVEVVACTQRRRSLARRLPSVAYCAAKSPVMIARRTGGGRHRAAQQRRAQRWIVAAPRHLLVGQGHHFCVTTPPPPPPPFLHRPAAKRMPAVVSSSPQQALICCNDTCVRRSTRLFCPGCRWWLPPPSTCAN